MSRRSRSSGLPSPVTAAVGHPISRKALPWTEKPRSYRCSPQLRNGTGSPAPQPPKRTASGSAKCAARMRITSGRSISTATPACSRKYSFTIAPVAGSLTPLSAISVACTCSSE